MNDTEIVKKLVQTTGLVLSRDKQFCSDKNVNGEIYSCPCCRWVGENLSDQSPLFSYDLSRIKHAENCLLFYQWNKFKKNRKNKS